VHISYRDCKEAWISKTRITIYLWINQKKKSKSTSTSSPPHPLWTIRTNENMNGLIREYTPKGAERDDYADSDIQNAEMN